MQKFQELLTEAAQLKEAQLKNQRKNYQSLPEYLKSGLNYSRKFQQLRKQDFLIQMTISQKLKKQGNELFKIQHYQQALNKYEESLGIFRYIIAKSYENMKDEDLAYQTYSLAQNRQQYSEEYTTHLIALYLNICSCLTKLNKKEDAIHSADQALKIKQTAKGYYKKAQAFLQFINKDTSDIKLGFYYLNKSYEISKDPSIIQQMHKIKKQIDEERDKQKKWFKFMFDKNSQTKNQSKIPQVQTKISQVKEQRQNNKKEGKRLQEINNLQNEKGFQCQKQDVRLEKTKQKLSRYLDPSLTNQQWIDLYEGEFIAKHGSKIYSIIQLYGYKEYLGEYKSLLAQSLQFKKQQQLTKRKQLYTKYFQWLKDHPIDKINKYTQRYDLQTQWIRQERKKKGEQAQNKEAKLNIQEIKVASQQKIKQIEEEQSINVQKDNKPSQATKQSNLLHKDPKAQEQIKAEVTYQNSTKVKEKGSILTKSFLIALSLILVLILSYTL